MSTKQAINIHGVQCGGLAVPHDVPGHEAHARRGQQAQRARVGAVLRLQDARGQAVLRVRGQHRHALLEDYGARVHALLEVENIVTIMFRHHCNTMVAWM